MNKIASVGDIREELCLRYLRKDFVKDKTGTSCVEIIGAQFIANEDCIFGSPNLDYIRREFDWYNSLSRNVNDIEEPIPEIWKKVASKEGSINSNYGWCIYSEENHDQYVNVFNELKANPNSRRAQMIYTRPNIWNEYNQNGMSDFICTTAVQYFIRDRKLHSYVTMRSNDAFHGYRNDVAWQKHVQQKLASELNVQVGDLIWNVASLHVYESQFYLIDHYAESGRTHITKSDYAKLYNLSVS